MQTLGDHFMREVVNDDDNIVVSARNGGRVLYENKQKTSTFATPDASQPHKAPRTAEHGAQPFSRGVLAVPIIRTQNSKIEGLKQSIKTESDLVKWEDSQSRYHR